MASTMCRQPSTPIAPPMTVASVQNAIAGLPCTVPRAASDPGGVPRRQQPHRARVEEPFAAGPRGRAGRRRAGVERPARSSRAPPGSRVRHQAVVKTSAMLWPPKPKESLTAAVSLARRGSWRTMSSAWTAASSSGSSRLAVAGHDLLAQGQDREHRLQRAGGAEQVAGLALGGAHQHVLAERASGSRRPRRCRPPASTWRAR